MIVIVIQSNVLYQLLNILNGMLLLVYIPMQLVTSLMVTATRRIYWPWRQLLIMKCPYQEIVVS